jgi:lipopolysaccharide/colanic/teichoic acid biosynthesis glycosyltransferase
MICDVCKRLVDLLVSLVVLIVCLPLYLLIAVAVWLDSHGPVLFSQERSGRHGRRFRMLKFRSMVADAERIRARWDDRTGAEGPVFKRLDDPRVTRVGRFLRRASLDELPQFVNVLLGHMSLVGPRPLPAYDVENYRALPQGVSRAMVEEWLALRRTVRPGITGLWQVRGRSALPLQGWIRYDLEYVRKRGCLLDAKILVLTPLAVLSGRGAT